jgi:hypothetical protein
MFKYIYIFEIIIRLSHKSVRQRNGMLANMAETIVPEGCCHMRNNNSARKNVEQIVYTPISVRSLVLKNSTAKLSASCLAMQYTYVSTLANLRHKEIVLTFLRFVPDTPFLQLRDTRPLTSYTAHARAK